jgi:hypothetical protein
MVPKPLAIFQIMEGIEVYPAHVVTGMLLHSNKTAHTSAFLPFLQTPAKWAPSQDTS